MGEKTKKQKPSLSIVQAKLKIGFTQCVSEKPNGHRPNLQLCWKQTLHCVTVHLVEQVNTACPSTLRRFPKNIVNLEYCICLSHTAKTQPSVLALFELRQFLQSVGQRFFSLSFSFRLHKEWISLDPKTCSRISAPRTTVTLQYAPYGHVIWSYFFKHNIHLCMFAIQKYPYTCIQLQLRD